jgi:hypothetical protein
MNTPYTDGCMITLLAQNLTWLNTDEDCPSDLCAHGTVCFAIDDLEFVAPSDGEWTLSAAAIHLLRTLDRDHVPDNPVGEKMIPHCGHGIYDEDDNADVIILGCDIGVDFSVVHGDGLVTITSAGGESRSVAQSQWANAVQQFSTAVRQFYDSSAAKKPFDDHERKGYEKMMSEWNRRHPRSTNEK